MFVSDFKELNNWQINLKTEWVQKRLETGMWGFFGYSLIQQISVCLLYAKHSSNPQDLTVDKTAQILTLMEFVSWWVERDGKIDNTECEVPELWKSSVLKKICL